MTKEDIERSLVQAGWQLDGGFSGHLVIGEDHDVSILVPQWAWESSEPAFELCDGERELTYWVGEIPTPRQAATLLDEHGGAPDEERSQLDEFDLSSS